MTIEPPSGESQGATPPLRSPPPPTDDSAFGPLFASAAGAADSPPAGPRTPEGDGPDAGAEGEPFASPDRRFALRWLLLAMPLGLALVFAGAWPFLGRALL